MSGLEKFQANEAWRAKVKKLLIMQRKPIKQPKVPEVSDRFSLDLDKDLEALLKQKRVADSERNSKRESAKIPEEKMENDEKMRNNGNFFDGHGNTMKPIPKNFSTRAYCDDTIIDCRQQQRCSDESFMALEKMCDKTASDPNSTLFQYIHSDNKERIVEDVKKRRADGNKFRTPCKDDLREIDEEAKSLQRLLNDLCMQEQKQLENETPLKGIDCTQLDDIEAPSKLWDTTIVGDTTLQTSPVKMVGLLRPSTIIEENCDDQSNTNSLSGDECASMHTSYQSALKGSETSTTSYYETAYETTGTSAATSNKVRDYDIGVPNSQASDKSLVLINLDNTIEVPATEATTGGNVSVFGDPQRTQNNENLSPTSSFDESLGVIELLSDDEAENVAASENKNITIKEEFQLKVCADAQVAGANVALDGRVDTIDLDDTLENDKENRNVFNESGEKSLHFNDTMEEVEYMMKKGMQYMAASSVAATGNVAAVANHQSPIVKEKPNVHAPTVTLKPPQLERQRTFTTSPNKLNVNSHFGSPAKKFVNGKPTAVVTGTKAKTSLAASPRRLPFPSSPKRLPFPSSPRPKPLTASPRSKPLTASPRRAPLSSAQKNSRFLLSMKPMPKMELFKKPATAIPTRLKEPCATSTSKQFSHIVSPIGAYMKNTAVTPLMSNLKQRSERPDVHNATVFRELERETRIYQPKFGVATGNTMTKTTTLPKKAYISSEFKHITDERTPVTIPGGKNIQKYLENAMLPTVVRHEGKLKMPKKVCDNGNRKTATNKTSLANTTQRNDGSLANLSLMSGDISVYTMKDARKF